MVQLAGRLARRTTPLGDACPIDRAIHAVGTRSALLLLREANYGTQRFDDFVTKTGLTEAVCAGRLAQLVELGILRKEPYREPGSRTRNAYVITPSGVDLLPALLALGQWAAVHHPERGGPRMTHQDCGGRVRVALVCDQGHDVDPDDLIISG